MFKDIFVELLQKNKITAYKLSKDIDVSEPTLSKWKNGNKYPSYENILKLSNYFHVSTDYLFEREEKKDLPNNIDQSVHSSMIEYNAPVANSNINSIEKEKKLPVIQAIVDGVESLEETDQAEVLLYIYKLKNKPSKN